MFAAVWPLLRMVSTIHAGPLPAWWMMALQVVFFIYLDDFLYYWFHRAMHTRWLYCGYDIPWTPTHLLPFNDGPTHHDVHHERVKGNYAGFLPLWDRVFGTSARGYAEELAARRTV